VKPDHIIQKVIVEINTGNKEKAHHIKNDINRFLSLEVFPEIEKYMTALEQQLAGDIIQIPRLELDLDAKSSTLNAELKDKITQFFQKRLAEMTKAAETSDQKIEKGSEAYLVRNQEKWVQTFIYFLENGSMPWWNSEKKNIPFLESTAFEDLLSASSFQKSLISVLPKKQVKNRMINQLTDVQIAQLCLKILEKRELKINLETDIIHHISKLSQTDRIIVWRLVLDVLSEYLTTSNSNFREYLLQKVSTARLAGLSTVKDNSKKWKTIVEIFPFITEHDIVESVEIIKNHSKEKQESPKTSEETIQKENIKEINSLSPTEKELNQKDGQYIQNAGLILIHPFIKTFFEHCDLLDPKTQKLTDPERCAHLLHYIATGKTNAAEYDMIFEKFLCNIPMNQTINRHIKLSRKHKTQAKNVIESVQHNWAPMKKSSAALLQNEFFQRSGKLVIADHEYTLTVERKTQDILLEKLAWGIGLVKLPWKKKFMFVNW